MTEPDAAGPTWAVVVAGGRGARFGAFKQFSPLGGARVVDWAVGAARRTCAGVVLVLPAGHEWSGPAVDAVVTGGDTRSASVRAGLAAVPAGVAVVVVHDAARPVAGPGLFAAVIAAVRDGADAAVPAIAVVDTLARLDGPLVAGAPVVGRVERDGVVAVQTPQAFRAAALRAVHAALGEGTDDAGLVAAAGGTVVVVPGDPRNLKVTSPHDLEVVAALLGERQ